MRDRRTKVRTRAPRALATRICLLPVPLCTPSSCPPVSTGRSREYPVSTPSAVSRSALRPPALPRRASPRPSRICPGTTRHPPACLERGRHPTPRGERRVTESGPRLAHPDVPAPTRVPSGTPTPFALSLRTCRRVAAGGTVQPQQRPCAAGPRSLAGTYLPTRLRTHGVLNALAARPVSLLARRNRYGLSAPVRAQRMVLGVLTPGVFRPPTA